MSTSSAAVVDHVNSQPELCAIDMASMQHTTEPSRRPFASKLTGFMRGTKSKKQQQQQQQQQPPLEPTGSGDNCSVFGFKRQKRAAPPAQDNALDFKPLEVDLNSLESMRLSEGWLESPKRKPEREQEQKQTLTAQENATTPIAAMFASKSVLNFEGSGSFAPQPQFAIPRRPLSVVEPNGMPYGRRSMDLASNSDAQSSKGSILDRGRPVEPSLRNVSDPPSKPPSWRQELPPLQSFNKDVGFRDPVLRPTRSSSGGVGSITAKLSAASSLQIPGKLDVSNRHSMYAVGVQSLGPPKIVQTRSSTAAPVDRIQAWQKSITSAPNPLATSISSPAVATQSTVPVRRTSNRAAGGLGNRLAWIRELEEKKSASTNNDLGVFKKQSGSVSNKLAMFENKQKPAVTPVARLPPLTRSNSSTSTNRFSSAGLGSISSTSGNVVETPRTSIDTVRSSHRTSSVMDYYDDTFRDKMESMVNGYTEKDKADAPKKQRVTTQFIPVVKPEREAEKPSAVSQPESSSSDAGSEVAETAPVSALESEGATNEAQKPKASSETETPKTIPTEKEEEFQTKVEATTPTSLPAGLKEEILSGRSSLDSARGNSEKAAKESQPGEPKTVSVSDLPVETEEESPALEIPMEPTSTPKSDAIAAAQFSTAGPPETLHNQQESKTEDLAQSPKLDTEIISTQPDNPLGEIQYTEPEAQASKIEIK